MAAPESRARLAANFSPDELAELWGLAPRTIERLDRGELDNPGVRHILRLGDVVRCSVEQLIEDDWRDRSWRPA